MDSRLKGNLDISQRHLIDKKEEFTSTDMPLSMTIHNIEITLGKSGQLARAAGAIAKLIANVSVVEAC